uniref:Uncharacterized protein n=1 Tax=Arundo donax TaxID=35708 RepID=A0A0A9FGA9_ARUDO
MMVPPLTSCKIDVFGPCDQYILLDVSVPTHLQLYGHMHTSNS